MDSRKVFSQLILLALLSLFFARQGSSQEVREDVNGKRLHRQSDGALYLVDEGVKRHVPNPTTATNLFGPGWLDGVIREDPHPDEVLTGTPIKDGAYLAIVPGTNPVYLVEDTKRHILSEATMALYSFDWNQIREVSQTTLDAIPDAAPIGVMRERGDLNGRRVLDQFDGSFYLVDEGVKRHVPNPATATNLFGSMWVAGGQTENPFPQEITTGPPIQDGAILAKATGADPVYLVEAGTKRHIVSPDVMTKYGFDWNQIQVMAPVVLDAIPDGPPIQ